MFTIGIIAYFANYGIGSILRVLNRSLMAAITQSAAAFLELGFLMLARRYWMPFSLYSSIIANFVTGIIMLIPFFNFKNRFNSFGLKFTWSNMRDFSWKVVRDVMWSSVPNWFTAFHLSLSLIIVN